MNLILTKKCNKGCPYCFAHQSRIEDPLCEMSLDQVTALIDTYNSKSIKLLGGEPTCHPQFKEIVEFLINRKKQFTLISNFLFSEDIRDFLLQKLTQGANIHFLVNSTDLDIQNRMTIWKNNYNCIYSLLYSYNKEEDISCGITLYEKNSAEYYEEYLDFLYENTSNIEILRVSLNFPGDENRKNANDVINNKQLGEKLLRVFNWCLTHHITPSPDCILFPCLFNNKEEFKFIKKYSNKDLRFKCGYTGAPADVFADGIVSYCYPLKGAIDLQLKDYESADEIQTAFLTEYQIAKSKVQLPKNCLTCDFLKSKICDGPCLAFYHLKDLDLPNWKE